MKNIKRIIMALGLSACVAFSAIGFAACSGTEGTPGKSAYEIAVENGFTGTEAEWLESLKSKSAYDIWLEAGHTGSEAEFLEWLKGEKGEKGDDGVDGKDGKDGKDGENGQDGKDGKDGENGQDGKDGKDGKDGENGQDGKDGKDGKDGENGQDGAGWLVGQKAPTADEGKDGDLYLDYSTWNVYHKQSGAWVLLGNIKGEKGDKGEDGVGGSQGEQTVSFELVVATGSTAEMPISGISAGIHIIEADLGDTKLSTGRLQAKIGEGGLSELVYSEVRSNEGHNIYYGYIIIAEGDEAITFSAIDEDVNATVTLKDWEMPTLSAGNPVEMPVNLYGATDANLIKVKLDPSIATGTYKIYINGNSAISGTVKLLLGSKSVSMTAANYNGNKTISIEGSDLNGDETYIYLIVASSGSSYRQINPVTVTLVAA